MKSYFSKKYLLPYVYNFKLTLTIHHFYMAMIKNVVLPKKYYYDQYLNKKLLKWMIDNYNDKLFKFLKPRKRERKKVCS